MTTGSCNFQSPLNIFLAFYVAEIELVTIQMIVKLFTGINNNGFELQTAFEKLNYFAKRAHAINIKIVNNGSFAGVYQRQYKSFETIIAGFDGNWQRTFYGLQASIEG